MMRIISIIILLHGIIFSAKSQIENQMISGVTTFIASNSVYVRFDNTSFLSIGDTIYLNARGVLQPCLTVEQKSTTSCVCNIIGECKVNKNDKVSFKIKTLINTTTEIKKDEEDVISIVPDSLVNIDDPAEKNLYEEKIKGRFSVATNSHQSSQENNDRHRIQLRSSLKIHHINNSKFSLESYFNYRKNILERDVDSDYRTSYFNVYNLALSYDIDSTTNISVGRKINRKISSLGPIDGFQIDKYFGSFFTGGVIGFKPDIRVFELNTRLLEYGGYFGYQVNNKHVYSETTIGILEQRNNADIDRRYAYLQHSSTIAKKLNLFSSIQMDLYKNVNGIRSTALRLTSLYISLRYRVSRKLSMMVSYDTRKRIIYYETLRTEVERLLADDEARQGIRSRINIRPIKYINLGIAYSKRFQNDSQNKSNNINGYLSISKLPIVQGRFTIRYNINTSNTLESNILSIRHSRTLIKRRLNAVFYYRLVNYKYLSTTLVKAQKYFGTNLSYRISKSLRFSVLGELSTSKDKQNIRINTKLIKRLYSK